MAMVGRASVRGMSKGPAQRTRRRIERCDGSACKVLARCAASRRNDRARGICIQCVQAAAGRSLDSQDHKTRAVAFRAPGYDTAQITAWVRFSGADSAEETFALARRAIDDALIVVNPPSPNPDPSLPREQQQRASRGHACFHVSCFSCLIDDVFRLHFLFADSLFGLLRRARRLPDRNTS